MHVSLHRGGATAPVLSRAGGGSVGGLAFGVCRFRRAGMNYLLTGRGLRPYPLLRRSAAKGLRGRQEMGPATVE